MYTQGKILILGAKGMLGHDLMHVFADYQPIGWDIDEIDITNQPEVFQKINQCKPEVVINAAAYTNVDGAEENRDLAKQVNAEAVGYLAEICQKIKATLIHYSTDYVFKGLCLKKSSLMGEGFSATKPLPAQILPKAKIVAGSQKSNQNFVYPIDSKILRFSEGYREDDQPINPLNFYGQSKFWGEEKILGLQSEAYNLRFYLIRTAWLFGPKSNPGQHKNFIETILKLAQEKKEIKVVDDQFGSPTYTYDLALATKNFLENEYPFGIYHLTNSGVTNWYEFAREIVKLTGSRIKILPCATEEFPRPAQRPKYSILINTKFPKLRSWQEALSDYLKIKSYSL